MKKKVLALLLTGCLLVGTTACGGTSAAPASSAAQTSASQSASAAQTGNLRFMWWGGESRHQATVAATEKFTQTHPGITVDCEYGGFDGYFDKLLTQMAGNNAPDVVQMSYTNAAEYVNRGQLEPLTKYIKDGTLRIDDLNQVLLDNFKVNGEYYAIPTGVNYQVMMYNKGMFEKFKVAPPVSGMTMDEVYAKAKELTDAARAAGEKNVWGITLSRGNFDVFFQRPLVDLGGKMWTDDLSAAAFNTPEGAQALAYIKKPLAEGFAPPIELTLSNPSGITDFELGRTGIYIEDASMAAGVADKIDFEMGLELVPFGNHHKAIWYRASQVFVITKQSKHPEMAAKLIDYLINDVEAGGILKFVRGVPPNETVRKAVSTNMNKIDARTMELLTASDQYTGDGVPMPFPPGFIEVYNEFDRLEESYFYNQLTAEQVLTQLEQFANSALAKFH